MFDLNGKDFQETSIFNNGKAGLVKDVTISVELRGPSEPETYAPYRLVVADSTGAVVKGWFNYPTDNEQKTKEQNEAAAKREVSRVLHIARAVMGADYKFPAIKTAKEALDVLFKLVGDNAGSKKYNVFVTYGTKSYPNKKGYLNLRYFNFIEDASTGVSKLRASDADLLERVVADDENGNVSIFPASQSGDTTDWTEEL